MTRYVLPIVVACGTVIPSLAAAAEFALEKNDRGNVAVLLDGQPFTEYLIDTGAKPILWPIVGPTSAEMTRAYPMRPDVPGEKQDHPHQRSFWFTHGEVNGVDFWSELDGHGTIVHRDYLLVAGGEQGAIVTANDWLGPDGRLHLSDERKLVFRAGDGWRTIDFDIKLTAPADAPVVFGDTKEGSFGVRIPTVMDVNSNMGGHIVNAEGLTDGDTWGKASPWVDYYGPVEGHTIGIAILNHPSSFRSPTYWHVRDYGLFAANPFGLHHFKGIETHEGEYTLPAGESMTLRYRAIFHQGDAQEAGIAEAYSRYAAGEP